LVGKIKRNAYIVAHWANKNNKPKILAKSHEFLIQYHRDYASIDSAFFHVDTLKQIFKAHAYEIELAHAYLKQKELFMVKADYAQASKCVYDALKLFENNKNQRGIALCYVGIADLKYYERNYAEGVEWCNKAIEILTPLNFPEDLAFAYRIKANDQLFSGTNLENALQSINKSIEIYKNINEYGIPMMASINWRGNILKYMERYEEAIADYQANYDNSKAMGLERYLIPSLANIGHVHVLKGDYAKAIPFNLQAIEIMKKTGRVRNLWENYMHVSDAYEAIGDYKNALHFHHLYANAFEEFKDNTIFALESEAQAKYQTGKKNATIRFQNEKIAEQKRTEILYIILATLMALILFGLFYNFQKRKKINKELHILNNKLDIKNKQNELLLREIHHRVKNNLEMVKSLIELQSAQLNDPASKEAMMASQNRVQSMGIIHQKLYQGEHLGTIEMKDYFLNLSEGIIDTFNAENKIKIECIMEDLELDVDTAIPIGLIVNELLTNALKYAFPNRYDGKINICLKKIDLKTLSLKVTDNGIGKLTKQKSKGTGFGTQLIRLLTQQLNGQMQEDLTQGTSIQFQFKLNHEI